MDSALGRTQREKQGKAMHEFSLKVMHMTCCHPGHCPKQRLTKDHAITGIDAYAAVVRVRNRQLANVTHQDFP